MMSSSNQRPANRGFRSVFRCALSHYRPVPYLSAPEPVKQGRRVIGNIGFTRSGQEYLTKLARDLIADDDRLYASQQSDLDPEG